MRPALVLICIPLLALGACAGPAPPRPLGAAVAAPSRWRDPPALTTVSLSADWWRGFGDPDLSALVDAAIADNTDIAIAAARVREARAQEAVARSQLFPSLDLGVGASQARTVGPLGRPIEGLAVQPVFQAAYELDLFGRVSSQVAAARLGAQASVSAEQAARLSVAAATSSGYITLLGLDARLAVVRATLAARSEALRLATSRARAGYTSDLELRQAEAEYQSAAQIVPQTELAIRRQENALSVLAGRLPGPVRRGALDRLALPGFPPDLPSDVLRRRPDVAQAEALLAASDASLAAARAQFLPSIRLNASLGAVASSALGDPVAIWSLGGSVLAPVFSGGRIAANADAAAARRDQAAFAYRRAALTAFRETEDGLASLQRLADQRQNVEAQRRAVADALRHATNRYQAGYSPYFEQLDAQRALLAADLQDVQLRTDQLNAAVALYQAVGGGLPSAQREP